MDFATRIRPGPKPFLGPAAWAVLFALLFAALASRLGTDASFDFKNYHFYNGFAANLDRTGLDIVPAQLQTAFYYGLDAIYYDLFTSLNGHPVLLNILLSLPYAVAAVALFLMARVFVDAPAPWRDIVCALVAIVGVTGASSLSTLATTMTEVVPGLPLLVGLTLWLRFEKAERTAVWTALPVGALAGLSVAFKLTEAPLFVGMVLAIGARLGIGARSALVEAIAFSLAGLVVFAAVDAAWLIGNARAYGNPIFPLFNDVFKSDLISASPWTDLRFMPKTRLMAAFYPAYWAFRLSFDASDLIVRDPRILLGCVSALVILAIDRQGRPSHSLGDPASRARSPAAAILLDHRGALRHWVDCGRRSGHFRVPQDRAGPPPSDRGPCGRPHDCRNRRRVHRLGPGQRGQGQARGEAAGLFGRGKASAMAPHCGGNDRARAPAKRAPVTNS